MFGSTLQMNLALESQNFCIHLQLFDPFDHWERVLSDLFPDRLHASQPLENVNPRLISVPCPIHSLAKSGFQPCHATNLHGIRLEGFMDIYLLLWYLASARTCKWSG